MLTAALIVIVWLLCIDAAWLFVLTAWDEGDPYAAKVLAVAGGPLTVAVVLVVFGGVAADAMLNRPRRKGGVR